MSIECGVQQRDAAEEFRFIEGWLTDQFKAGVEPDYGYPKNHLPEPRVQSMKVETTFVTRVKP